MTSVYLPAAAEPAVPEGEPQAEPIVSDEDVEAVIALCGGDPRMAVRTLLVAYSLLEDENTRMERDLSAGYVRARASRHPRGV